MRHRAPSKRVPAVRDSLRSRWNITRGRAITALIAVVAVFLAPQLIATSAQAVTHTFVVDSLVATTNVANTRDANPGDGSCLTAAGTCTLRAALEESNALNLPAGAVLITVKDGLSGNIQPAALMSSTGTSSSDSGAYFEVTAPVIIDLKNQVSANSLTDAGYTMFHLNGPNIELRNFTQILAGRNSFVMGPKANGVTLDGGSSQTIDNYYPEAFMVIRDGAKNITVKNYQAQGFYGSAYSGIFRFDMQSTAPVENLVIDNFELTYPTGTACGAWDGSGCSTHIVTFVNNTVQKQIDGFTFKNSFVSNLKAYTGFPFSMVSWGNETINLSNLDISNNEFINMAGSGTSFITLPTRPIGGTNVIDNNKIVSSGSGNQYGIYWNGSTTTGSAGDLSITNNYFNGYRTNGVFLQNTGDVRVESNTFGTRSASQARPAIAEETRNGAVALVDNAANANGTVNTWYPSAEAAVLGTSAPEGAKQVVSTLAEDIPVCVAMVDVQAPTAAPLPADKVDLDVYWTEDRTAEIYLGRASELTGASAQLLLDLPVGTQEFPSTVVGESDTATIVDADTGVAGGYIRVQTIASDSGQSSQYSRVVGFSGSCRPELTIDQAADQNDPTLARDLHYTVSSTLPLDPDTVTAAVVDVSAEAVSETIDAERISPRVVAATPIAGSSNRKFDVVARVNDSAVVTVGVAAEKVTSVGGLTNRGAATSTDAAITFKNPISTKPNSFTLVTGEPDGKQYGFQVASTAPTPAADLVFTAGPDAAATEYDVELSTLEAVLKSGKTASEKVTVTAAKNDVAANTPVAFSHTVTSEDTNYDGLVIQSLSVKLFATDPSVQIKKRAFVDVSDSSTPEQIKATGTEALSGTRLTDGQSVCFVYEVSNISADDWATVLTDVTVTDTDARLGENGVIGTVKALEVGKSTMLSACSALIPVDTTVSDS